MDKIEEMMSRMIDYALERPMGAPSRVLLISLSKGGIEKIITPARMAILNAVKTKRPKTVGELARILDRPKESVSRDLRVLVNYGLLSFAKTGRQKTPRIEKDIIAMPLAM